MLKECAERGDDYDNHWTLVPICSKCEAWKEHWYHDIENNPEAHPFTNSDEPLVWGENAHRENKCPGWEYQSEDYPDTYVNCSCPCHWGIYYVNVYEADRAYGGPEEGGWWYDIGEPFASIPCETWKEAVEVREELLRKYPRTGKRNNYHGGEDYDIVIQKHFAKPYPKVTPHYE